MTHSLAKEKFVVISPEQMGYRYVVIVFSLMHGYTMAPDLFAWCQEHGVDQSGEFLYMPDEETFTLFKLTWL
jgi:hypothetical protein